MGAPEPFRLLREIYLRVSGVLYKRDYSGADAWALNATPLPMCNVEGSSMVPSVTSVHVTRRASEVEYWRIQEEVSEAEGAQGRKCVRRRSRVLIAGSPCD